jgi:hypothetical protein
MTRLKEHLLMWPALIILGGALIALLYGINSVLPESEAKYDCRVTEISPEFTVAMQEECRKKLRSQQ